MLEARGSHDAARSMHGPALHFVVINAPGSRTREATIEIKKKEGLPFYYIDTDASPIDDLIPRRDE